MRQLAVAIVFTSSVAVAAPSIATSHVSADEAEPSVIGGYSATLDPTVRPESGQFAFWTVYAPAAWFVGGEIAFGSPQVEHAEFAISYHALAGLRHRLSERFMVLADGGLGVSQQNDWEWDLLGDGDMTISTRTWAPSAAARVHLAGELGRIRRTHIGLALTSDARSTLDDSASLALGVGVGVYMTN